MTIYSDAAKRLFNSQPDRSYRLGFFRLYHANGFEARFFYGSTAYQAQYNGAIYEPNNVTANPIGGSIDTGNTPKTTIQLGIDCRFIQDFIAGFNGIDRLSPLLCDYTVVAIAGRPPLSSGVYDLDSFAGVIDIIRDDQALSVESIRSRADNGYTLSLSPPQLNKRSQADLYVDRTKFTGIIL